jgi:FHA domain
MKKTRSTKEDPLARHSLSPSELTRLLEAEREGKSVLAYRNAEGALELFALDGSERPFTIGRREGMDLVIGWDPEVSGLHAELQTVGGEVIVRDDGLSTNGTFVNGRRVRGRERLRGGDRIRVGQTVLAFKAATVGSGGKTAVASSVRRRSASARLSGRYWSRSADPFATGRRSLRRRATRRSRVRSSSAWTR